MSYVIKYHQGSIYATITGNTVERYGFDAWGRRRNPVTLSYDNVTSHFDRGFTMHEHYDDFGLINMNGRMYDPLVGRMLSPDIVIQDEHNPQAYNRYSYCLNNPLRFTDPKLRREVTSMSSTNDGVTDYSYNFLYEDNELVCIFAPFGRVTPMILHQPQLNKSFIVTSL